MPEFLENPRHSSRSPVRCQAKVSLPSGTVETSTEDIGARGCQLVLMEPPQRGALMDIVLNAPGHSPSLHIDGRVAWVSQCPPWRVGIAYLPGSLAAATKWIEGLRSSSPSLFPPPRALERVAVDAFVYLGSVPRLVDFSTDEVELLKTVAAGMRVADLRSSFALGWQRGQRAFFSLLAQGHLTLSRGSASHPLRWRGILGEVAVPQGAERPSLTPPLSSPKPTPAPTSTPKAPAAVSAPLPTPVPSPVVAIEPTATHSLRRDRTNDARAGGGWRAPAGPRPKTAEEMFQMAKSEISAGRLHQALALLRLALTLAPGDPEIAITIGVAMQSGRLAP
jgi:hypothetical protein